jgi:thymidine kinase
MAEFIYYCGTMDSGKSTLALQTAHNRTSRGLEGIILTNRDRGGEGVITSRLGLRSEAFEVTPELNIYEYITTEMAAGRNIQYVICDETQFYDSEHIDQLALVVDELEIDVFAFGILTDFRTKLFPGSERLIELADRVLPLQVEALCWCGARATHNARVANGQMITEGDQIVPGDVASKDVIGYEVLCRKHHIRKVNFARSK